MKTPSFLSGLAIALIATASLYAQEGPKGGPGWDPAERAKQRLEHMKTALDLTDEQVKKIEDIQASQMEAMKALREDESLTSEQKREKSRQLMDETRQKVDGVLTPEQKAKWEEARKARGEGRRGFGKGEGKGPWKGEGKDKGGEKKKSAE